jgi:hypothetical protein
MVLTKAMRPSRTRTKIDMAVRQNDICTAAALMSASHAKKKAMERRQMKDAEPYMLCSRVLLKPVLREIHRRE